MAEKSKVWCSHWPNMARFPGADINILLALGICPVLQEFLLCRTSCSWHWIIKLLLIVTQNGSTWWTLDLHSGTYFFKYFFKGVLVFICCLFLVNEWQAVLWVQNKLLVNLYLMHIMFAFCKSTPLSTIRCCRCFTAKMKGLWMTQRCKIVQQQYHFNFNSFYWVLTYITIIL